MPIPPFLIQFLAKYIFQILFVILLVCAYFAWEHHIRALQEAEDIAKSEKVTKELLQKKMVEVKIQNDEQLRIKNEAIEHYVARNATLDDDISRLQNRACRSGNTVPRTVQDRERKEETNVGPDRSLFAEAVALLNECYFEIDKIPTK